TENHDGQNEPGRCRAYGILDDAADVVGRARQVAEHDGGGSPVRDEGEHDAADDNHLRGTQKITTAGSVARSRSIGHGESPWTCILTRRASEGLAGASG